MEVFSRYLRYVQLYFRFIIDDRLHSQCKLISNWSRYVHSFNVCTLKYLVFNFGYGILGWRWKCSWPYLKYTYFYTFPLFFDDMLYSQWQVILTCARYVYSFVVYTLKFLLFTFGYGILRWWWEWLSCYLTYVHIHFHFIFIKCYTHNGCWFQLAQGMDNSSKYGHPSFYFLYLVMAFSVEDGSSTSMMQVAFI